MGWIQLATIIIQFIYEIWKARRESDDKKRKQATEIIQSGVRGVVDDDLTRITISFDKLRDLRR